MSNFNYKEFKERLHCGDLTGLDYLEKILIRDYKNKITNNYTFNDYIVSLFNAVLSLNNCMYIYETTNIKDNFNYDLYYEVRDLLFQELGFDFEDLWRED